MSRLVAAVLVLSTFSSCAPLESPPLVRSPQRDALNAPDPPGATAPLEQVTAPPRIAFEGMSAADAARASATFGPAEGRLQACVPGSTGVIRIRISSEHGNTLLSVQPGTELDPRKVRCTLEALSTLDIDNLDVRGSPSDRTSGFTALVRIEW